MPIFFFLNFPLTKLYEVYWKSIKTKAAFTKTEMNNEWNIHFLQNKAN